MNDAELADLIEAQSKPKSRHLRAKATAVAAVCVAGGLGLDRLGLDGHLASRGLVVASPVMAAALLVFLRHAWGQNFIAPPLARDVTDAEPPTRDDLASEPSLPVATRADVASQPTVTVTVLPLTNTRPALPIPFDPAPPAVEPVYAPWEDRDGDD